MNDNIPGVNVAVEQQTWTCFQKSRHDFIFLIIFFWFTILIFDSGNHFVKEYPYVSQKIRIPFFFSNLRSLILCGSDRADGYPYGLSKVKTKGIGALLLYDSDQKLQ